MKPLILLFVLFGMGNCFAADLDCTASFQPKGQVSVPLKLKQSSADPYNRFYEIDRDDPVMGKITNIAHLDLEIQVYKGPQAFYYLGSLVFDLGTDSPFKSTANGKIIPTTAGEMSLFSNKYGEASIKCQ